MPSSWTFGRKLGVGFGVVLLFAVIMGVVSIYALGAVVTAKDRVIDGHAAMLVDAQRLRTAVEWRYGAVRGFLVSARQGFADDFAEADRSFADVLGRLRQLASTEAERELLEQIAEASDEWVGAAESVMDIRRGADDAAAVAEAFEARLLPLRDSLSTGIDEFVGLEERRMADARDAATNLASSASTIVAGIIAFTTLLAALLGLVLTRTLSRQIGGAVGRVESSTTELQAAANQQATGAKEQVTAMREIATTITELLATSRQIAESAQRVAQIAGQTSTGARAGETIVQRSADANVSVRRQVDVVVAHMIELGRKSQHIGSVVDIVSELAEQTNILAINATIEAAGAGESGVRFAVVADEIRKLADRVALSAKEIRSLVEDVRGSVNATVMATEAGSKAVDAGTREFGEVASTLRGIVDLVGTTTDAAREIELSTKQQTSAVEQVNAAISDVSQATRESETSAAQTLETAAQLATLSRELLRLVEPERAASA